MTRQPVIFINACDCITPHGNSTATHKALCEGRSSLCMQRFSSDEITDEVPLSLFDGLAATIPPSWMDRTIRFLDPVKGPEWGRCDTPIFVSSSNFGVDSLYYFRRTGDHEQLPYAATHKSVEQIRTRMGWSGNIAICSHACVSSFVAMHAALDALRAGWARKALVVSYDYLGPFVCGGFHALKILNSEMPRPYHEGTSGSIGLGEGAAYAVLSAEPHGYRILANSLWNEMFHLTANDPSGSGFEQCLRPLSICLEGRRAWVKGHGTGTLEAGKLEALEVNSVLPDAPLVGWKGAIGHTLGSCGLVETAIACRAMDCGTAPGTVGGAEPNFAPNISLDNISITDRSAAVLLCNAFGGAHAGLVICND